MPPSDPPLPPSPDELTGLRLDATALKVLAHPLRSRLLSRLRTDGPATATALATALSTNSGATSYHLRRLEAVGLVTDTGEGTGRRRLWRASTDSHQYEPSDFTGDDDAETALGWLQRDYSRHLGERFERWLDVEHGWPDEWRDAVGMSDSFVIATPEQLRAMQAELWAVLERYRRVGQGNPTARRVAAYLVSYPLDLDRPPRGERTR
ncbi:helix-turn-helix domain-containing protein [Phycicoccus sp. CSK15P-2]|uniref:helix-turn-helix domain-containing protein n=1 Tax=Phycicoccus sp. CSK15P-2 TaxID=2807627 RepID=UPI001950E41C|nr:helix-turn-helix domain-containing protein [Phycicoccus sp. CSK15P-2]MBM6405694.1 helix-turn-helix domain-containing protein [Phycicoccus sp. CSK15P-2]